MKTIKIVALLIYLSSATAAFCANSSIHLVSQAEQSASAPLPSAPDGQEWSEGEVVRWDPSTLKVTLRHGPLKNLGMPGMTMVFRVQSAAIAKPIQVGAKIVFRAEQVHGAYLLTHVQAAP